MKVIFQTNVNSSQVASNNYHQLNMWTPYMSQLSFIIIQSFVISSSQFVYLREAGTGTYCFEENMGSFIFKDAAKKLWIKKTLLPTIRIAKHCFWCAYKGGGSQRFVVRSMAPEHAQLSSFSFLIMASQDWLPMSRNISAIWPNSVWLLAVCSRKTHAKLKQHEKCPFSDRDEHRQTGISGGMVRKMEKL